MSASPDDGGVRMHVPPGHKQSAVLCVLKAGDEFLLLKRSRQPNKGKFTPVGGKIDPFESPAQAALRETLEETGIRTDDAKYCGLLVETSPGKYNWICFVYLIEIEPCAAPECNEGILKWVAVSQLPNIPTPATDLLMYQYILEGKPFMFSAQFNENLELLEMKEEIESRIVFSKGRIQPQRETSCRQD